MNRNLFLLSAFTVGLVPGLAAAQPKFLVDTTQILPSEAAQASRLKADGTWLLTQWSPSMTAADWAAMVNKIGPGLVVSEDGGISRRHLMDTIMWPHLVLGASNGNYVRQTSANYLAADTSIGGASPLQWFLCPPNWTTNRPSFSQQLTSGVEMALLSSAGWVQAQGGGGSSMFTGSPNRSYWETLRLVKPSGSGAIRQGDVVTPWTWNGFFNGGNFVGTDGSQGGVLFANRSTPNDRSAQFTAMFGPEASVGTQFANPTYAMAYMEFSEISDGRGSFYRDWTLTPADITELRRRTGKKVIAFTRSYVPLSECPQLPTHKREVDSALACGDCGGIAFEIAAGSTSALASAKIIDGIAAIAKAGKQCFIKLPPRGNSTNYSADALATLRYLKANSPYYKQLNIILAVYSRQDTHVTFIGGNNSVEGALNALRTYR